MGVLKRCELKAMSQTRTERFWLATKSIYKIFVKEGAVKYQLFTSVMEKKI